MLWPSVADDAGLGRLRRWKAPRTKVEEEGTKETGGATSTCQLQRPPSFFHRIALRCGYSSNLRNTILSRN
jgi:hypothetical protein